MSDNPTSEYELYTSVRLRDLSTGAIVDRMGPDYIVDIGKDSSDWDSITVRQEGIVCKAVFDPSYIRKKVVVIDLDGDERAGLVDDIYPDEDGEAGVLLLDLYIKETDGIIEYKESEVREIKLLDYDADHYCRVYQKVIDCDLCYESVMVLNKSFKVESLPELKVVADIEEARRVCASCIYSDLS